jgi:hypothetical protein
MAFNYKLPRVQELDGLSILNAPTAATDVVLANGVLTIKDATGASAITLKASDLLGFRYNAYTAGTANVVDVELAAATLVAQSIYSLTVSAPYVQNFFGGGQETRAVYIPRTYTVSSNGTVVPPVAPTIADLQTKFINEINSDPSAYFTATAVGTKVRITSISPLTGQLFVETSVPLAVISTATAWVAPVGSTTEILRYVPNSTLVSGNYNRYIVLHRQVIRHNAVSGLGVIRNATSLVYLNTAGAGTAATVTKLTSILDGSWAVASLAQAANYQGSPAV